MLQGIEKRRICHFSAILTAFCCVCGQLIHLGQKNVLERLKTSFVFFKLIILMNLLFVLSLCVSLRKVSLKQRNYYVTGKDGRAEGICSSHYS